MNATFRLVDSQFDGEVVARLGFRGIDRGRTERYRGFDAVEVEVGDSLTRP